MLHSHRFRRIYLFARPSFLTGIARILDPQGKLNTYNTSESAQLADARAIRSDWLAVGDDLRSAIQSYEESDSDRYDR